jgi:glycosyltransferase involved in cell wall biosynthesis
MKFLIAHNRYRYPGGEDVVFCREGELLRSAGHEVVEYVRENTEIPDDGFLGKAITGIRTLWAWDTARELQSILRKERPELVHFHNTFPLISPAAYYACKAEGVPIVQSLHNPRILCPAATLYRNGRTCEDCLGRSVAWPGVVHACYCGSFSQTAVVAGMLALHRYLGTWQDTVDAYIVFTEFFRQKFIAGGIPREKIFVKPHFLNTDPGMKQKLGDYALFLGRLVPQKGVLTLLKAWQHLKHIPLRIAGEGQLEQEVQRLKQHNPSISTTGHLTPEGCLELIKGARFLIWPSEGYETFGLVAIEAFACGTPVIASKSGAVSEIVEDGKTGLHFEAGNAEDLADKVEGFWNHPHELETMGRAARLEFENKYRAPANYVALMRIYDTAIERKVLRDAHPRHCMGWSRGHEETNKQVERNNQPSMESYSSARSATSWREHEELQRRP